MMNPSAFFNLQYSGASIAYIESMEYFSVKTPKTKMEETLAWGYQAGCGVFNDGNTCADFPMVCQKDGVVCSADHYSLGTCSTTHSGSTVDSAAGGCNVFREGLDCRYQEKLGSRCVEVLIGGSSQNATCADIQCSSAGGGNFNVVITKFDTTFTCNNGDAGV